MTTYLVTGGTGFLGRHLLARLVRRPGARVHVLVREASVPRLERLVKRLSGPGTVEPLLGDARADLLGLDDAALDALAGSVDHVVHLAALYDLAAGAADNEDLNVGGHPPGARRGGARAGPSLPPRVLHRGGRRAPRHVHRGDVRRGTGAALGLPRDQVRGGAPGPRADRRPVARLPAGRRGRRQPHRRDGQGRRPVLLPAGPRQRRRAPGRPTPAAGAAGPGRHQRRPGRLRRRRDGRADPRGRARRAGVPPRHRPDGAPGRRLQRAGPGRGRPAGRAARDPPAAPVGRRRTRPARRRARGPEHRRGAGRAPGHPAVGHPAHHVPAGLLDGGDARGARPARRRAGARARPSTRTRCTCTGRSTWTRCARAGARPAARSTAAPSSSPERPRASAARPRWPSRRAAASRCCSPAARPSWRRSATRSWRPGARRSSTRSTSPPTSRSTPA